MKKFIPVSKLRKYLKTDTEFLVKRLGRTVPLEWTKQAQTRVIFNTTNELEYQFLNGVSKGTKAYIYWNTGLLIELVNDNTVLISRPQEEPFLELFIFTCIN